MRKKLPSLNEKKYKTNPFIIELAGKMYLQPRANTIVAKEEAIVNKLTGEIAPEGVLIGRRKIVDKSQFAKIYASEIGIIYELSKTAQKVFLHLTKIMDYENRAFLNYNQEYKDLGYKSGRSIINGLRSLIQKEIIANSYIPHLYWLNPTIVCKGERFAKYTEYVVDKSGESSLKQQYKNQIDMLPGEVQDKVAASTKRAQQANIFGDIDEI